MSGAGSTTESHKTCLQYVGKWSMMLTNDVVNRALDGDRPALDTAMAAANSFVNAFMETHIQDRNDAADVAQECLMDIWRLLTSGDTTNIRDFDAWCSKRAWHCINRYRERGWDGRIATNHEAPFTDCFDADMGEDEIDALLNARAVC